jgi:hypothetical protein
LTSSTFLAGAETLSLQHQPGVLHALREAPSETMLDDQNTPKPLSVRLNVIINPLFASGSERAEQEKCAFVMDENVRSDRDNW